MSIKIWYTTSTKVLTARLVVRPGERVFMEAAIFKRKKINEGLAGCNHLLSIERPAVLGDDRVRKLEVPFGSPHEAEIAHKSLSVDPEPSRTPTFSRGIYGFVLYLASYLGLALFLIWAYVPENVLPMGSLPSKYWAIAIPAFFFTALILFVFCFYPGLILLMTSNLEDSHTIVDEHSKALQAVTADDGDPRKIPPLADIPLCEGNSYYTIHIPTTCPSFEFKSWASLEQWSARGSSQTRSKPCEIQLLTTGLEAHCSDINIR
ncbi:unnamed protein product, partial [Darwinula stevensoni]